MFSVEKGFADNEVPLCCDAHNQVCFPGEHNVLQGIVEVGEEIYKDHISETYSRVNDGEDQKQNVTNSKGK